MTTINFESWEEFTLGQLFDIKKGKRLTAADQEEGSTPYVGAIDSNNGISNHIGQDPIHQGNTISLSYNGSVGEAFYQPEPFWATDDVNVLYFKDTNGVKFSRNIALFICTVLKKEQYRYSYGRKWVLEKMKETIIMLPSKDGKPDWKYMEEYMNNLDVKYTYDYREPKPLPVTKWESFVIKNIIEIINGKGLTKQEIENNPGSLEAVQSGEMDNGCIGYIDEDYCVKTKLVFTKKPCLTVARSGSAGTVTFHPNGCVAGDSAKILLIKDENNANVQTYLFIKTVLLKLRYKYSYGRKVTKDLYGEEKIMLPSKDEKPDWEYMSRYILSLPYGDQILSK